MNLDMKVWVPELKEFYDIKNNSMDYFFDISKEGELKFYIYNDSIMTHRKLDCVPLKFTGKYDKNDKKIYEGHRLKYEGEYEISHETPYTIFWDKQSCSFACENESNFMSPDVWDEMEIIGNIFED